MKLIYATPSPFARKVRVALREKGIACDEQVDVPWNAATATTDHNPLGKVPVLITDGDETYFDSGVIIEYLETLGIDPVLIPADGAERVAVRQMEALADGICDAVVLMVLEEHRPQALQSADWIGRQQAKVERGTAALNTHLDDMNWLAGGTFRLTHIAAGCALAYLDLRRPGFQWRTRYPQLAAFSNAMEQRPSFAATQPEIQAIQTVK